MVQFTVLALLALPFVNAIPAPAPVPTPPGIPATTTAENELAKLTVAAQGSQDGYDRDLFPHWISQGQYVLPSLFFRGSNALKKHFTKLMRYSGSCSCPRW